MMYVPVIIWLLGSALGYVVLHKRGVKLTVAKNIVVGLLGPLSIPFAFVCGRS